MKIKSIPIDERKIEKVIREKYVAIHNKVAKHYLATYLTPTGLMNVKVNRTDSLLKIVNKEDPIIKAVKSTPKIKSDFIPIKDMMWKLVPSEHGQTWVIVKADGHDVHKYYYENNWPLFVYPIIGLAIGVAVGFIVISQLGLL